MEWLVPLGRLLFSAVFIQNGIAHFRQRAALTEYARGAGAPLPELTVPLTGAMLVIGGLSVLFGVYARIGAWLLVLFLVPAAFIMHRWWGLENAEAAQAQKPHFWKNLALAGAALMIACLGSGPYSLTP